MKISKFLTQSLVILSNVAYAVPGTVVNYTSPKGLPEVCIALPEMPGALYSKKDKEKEVELCAVNFYDDSIALCPKEKSTSPGTYIYSLKETKLSQSAAENNCSATDDQAEKVGKFKQTMNQKDTSGTYSGASLLYYHLSRFLKTNFAVPVAVYRTMDKDEHYSRVSKKGKGKSMNLAGWVAMRSAETNPSTYSERSRLFTSDLKQIYGAMLSKKGERYGTYFYGTRESGWANQYKDLKVAPPFGGIKTDSSLADAIQAGISLGKKSSTITKEIAGTPSNEQMVSWMQDMSEIAVMDYILSQQDRVGNIDYIWAWAYTEGNELKYKNLSGDEKKYSREKMAKAKLTAPAELTGKNPILIQRTILNDNDAGGLDQYTNFTKKFKLLQEIRHLNAGFYLKIQSLSKDLNTDGELAHYIHSTFGMAEIDYKSMVTNAKLAADILKASCKNRSLRFDLDTEDYITSGGKVSEVQVDCEATE
jgi:hypothetical protein